ncbi:glycosyltransferase family 2 protein [Thalassovita sp.]|uniref:glycosyltransferase family 2 protein n=1 Tax=Thalassovita sp. TaxID=1979401 RepID=UPI0029DE7A6B|nr:glycosyltransferase family 2 protein [Thalassovita sp.]
MTERFLAILCVRNEAAFILEWLAHHRACGFTDFLVFSNNCQDGTDTMLDRLAALGHLTHERNEGPHDARGIQFTALNRAWDLPVVRRTDWILPLDVDEFVNIHVADRTVQALTSALPRATAITLTWRLFGNAGIIGYEDTPITEQFTQAAPVVMHWPWRSAMFKTLFRNNGTYGALGVHRPRQPVEAALQSARWFDGEGRELDAKFRTGRIFSNYGQSNYRLAQMNHYPLGAMESYLLKADRGRAVHSDHALGMDYWVERNFCTDTDQSIQKLSPQVRVELAGLLADPDLARLHKSAVGWRRKRITELLAQEPYRALMGRLLMTPPSQPVPVQAARILSQHARHTLDGSQATPRKP